LRTGAKPWSSQRLAQELPGVAAGHAQVHEHHVGVARPHHRHGLPPVRRLPDHHDARLLVLPYPSQLFGGTEYHAFFTVDRFAEYVFNYHQIHSGSYTGTGDFSRLPPNRRTDLSVPDRAATSDVVELTFRRSIPSRSTPNNSLIEMVDSANTPAPNRRRISAEEFAAIADWIDTVYRNAVEVLESR
jgi:hypothetical protein